MSEEEYDLVVIGAGPGGYVAALRAAQFGWKVACVDENKMLGGTCLRIGCIPSKALLEASEKFHEASHQLQSLGVLVKDVKLDLKVMMKRKDDVVQKLCDGIQYLFKHNKVTHYLGRGKIAGPNQVSIQSEPETNTIRAKKILLATGSSPTNLPNIKSDGDRIGTSTEALSFPEVPEHLVVVGGGYIGLELGSVWNRLGSKVTVLEAFDRILPLTDSEIAKQAHKVFQKQGIKFQLSTKVAGITVKGNQCIVECEESDPIECDRVLLAIGRTPNSQEIGLEAVDIQTDKRGAIEVDENFQTSAENIYAIGDCIGGAMLAHKASDEAVACIEKLVTGYGEINYDVIPSVVYTEPEIAAVGKTEDELKAAEVEYRVGKFQFRGNGRAHTLGHPDGMVKVLADKKTDRVLGVHIIGIRAGDVIAEAATAMAFGASSEDIARCCHAHPTLAEGLKEASLAVDGRALHG